MHANPRRSAVYEIKNELHTLYPFLITIKENKLVLLSLVAAIKQL